MGSSRKMSKVAQLKLGTIYKPQKEHPKGILNYKVKSKRVNPFCYPPPKIKKKRESAFKDKSFKKSLSRKRVVRYKSMKDIYKSFRNLNLPKLKNIDSGKKKRVKFILPEEGKATRKLRM